ncbi:MAG: TadE/TadG family type IV pilus assembly protein [Coriobacteriia bacterium]|nr:TadE/TadG family type IV pilus assembly protein [Coriobacteriia bacterium]
MEFKTFYCIRTILNEAGQASLEAALLLPSLLLMLMCLLQPSILLYNEVVMRQAAGEATRLVAHPGSSGQGTFADERLKEFVQRRLRPIPCTSIFHVGGAEDWDIQIENDGDSVKVAIGHSVQPLPLFSALTKALNGFDGTHLHQEVEIENMFRPDWLRGDYDAWMRMWES